MTLQEKIGVFIFLLLVGMVYAGWVGLFVRYFWYGKVKKVDPPSLKSKYAIALHVLAILGILCMAWGHFVEPCRLELTTHEIYTPKLENSSFRIVQVTDTHMDDPVRNEDKLADLINPLEPDVIVFTGDALNTLGTRDRFKRVMTSLKAKLGKFAVRGNFDRMDPSIDLFNGTGFKLLELHTETVEKSGEKLTVTGFGASQALETAQFLLEKNPKDAFNVMLFHYPDYIEDLENANVDLYLAGHTHGGQVRLPLYGALVTLARHGKKYEAGRYRVKDTTLYVCRGIGLEPRPAPQVRFLCRPEVAVFDVKPMKEKTK